MKPVVLISRTPAGDAFVYARYANRECTDEIHCEPVPVGEALPALSAADVELLRVSPDRFPLA